MHQVNYEGHSKSSASLYVKLKKLFNIYIPIKCTFLLNSCELKADMTSF